VTKLVLAERKVSWSDTAIRDLQAIVEYIAEENLQAATDTLRRIEKRAEALRAQSLRGRIVPELRGIGVMHYRELIERPWRIVYRVEAQQVFVLAVLDTRRNLQTLLLERLIRS
jgi:toxin ParE1/3/4